MALATVNGLTPTSAARSRMEGRRAPGFHSPLSMRASRFPAMPTCNGFAIGIRGLLPCLLCWIEVAVERPDRPLQPLIRQGREIGGDDTRCVGPDDLRRDRDERAPEVIARLEGDDLIAHHVDAVQ